MFILSLSLILGLSFALIVYVRRNRRSQREHHIRTYMFPPGLLDKLQARRPELQLKDRQLVARALRQFFLVYLNSGFKQIAMSSQLVDDLWHEFILYTHHYQTFCQHAFGRYLHHTPAAVLGASANNNAHIRRTWWYACLEENINPRHATRLPLLFALDAKYDIANGFRYQARCHEQAQTGTGDVYCASDFYPDSSGGSDASTFSFSDDSGTPSGDSSSDGASCSGGCSGGCGGD